MEPPDTRYVAVGDTEVAYQIVGEGPIDVVSFYGLGSHIDMWWDYQLSADMITRIGLLGRLIMFDRRGTGASDGVPRGEFPT